MLALSLAVVATAAAKPISTLRLDAYSAGTHPNTPPVFTRSTLKPGGLYVATVQGTFSFYQAADYVAPQLPFTKICGQTGSAPQFSSLGGSGRVTEDAQFIFAYPAVKGCARGYRLPHAWLNFQANDGGGWQHPAAVAVTPLTRPTRNHAYNYALVGRGAKVGFRLVDTDTRDNYGTLKISLRRAAPSDCAGDGYEAFGLPSLADCLASATGPKPSRISIAKPLKLRQLPLSRVLRNGDVPSATNQQLPSGVVGAAEFVRLQAGSEPAAVAGSVPAQLIADGFLSAAVSRFSGGGLPELTSTAVLFRTPADAIAGLQTEASLAAALAPPSTTVSVGPAPAPAGTQQAPAGTEQAPAGTEQVTFTPQSPDAAGGSELILAAGPYVYTLDGVEAPDQVSPTVMASLLSDAMNHLTRGS